MDREFLTAVAIAAACAFSAAPAAAQHSNEMDQHPNGDRTMRPGPGDFHGCHGDRHRRSAGQTFGCSAFSENSAYADGEWALYNNRSWEPDSYNDWWHDRPDRAFPRWVLEQRARGTCDANRMWWSGSGWHC